MKLNLRLRDKRNGEVYTFDRFDLLIDGAELAGDTTALLALAMMGGSPHREEPALWSCGAKRGFFSGGCGPGPHELHAVTEIECKRLSQPHECAQLCGDCNAVELGS